MNPVWDLTQSTSTPITVLIAGIVQLGVRLVRQLFGDYPGDPAIVPEVIPALVPGKSSFSPVLKVTGVLKKANSLVEIGAKILPPLPLLSIISCWILQGP